MNRSDQDLIGFITASFPSVWALELLLTLRGDPRPWDRHELVATLRASELVVSKAVDALVAAGIASVDGATVNYLPINRAVAGSIEQVEQLYRTRPNTVRRAIVAASTGSAAAFAEAFKLRRDKDE